MRDFVNIHTLFDTFEDRTCNELSLIYQDPDRLKNVIRAVIGNTLSDSAIKGKKLLLKPNWVKHSTTDKDDLCLRTNDNFLLAALEIVLENGPSEIILGDAPIQGARWDQIVNQRFLEEIRELRHKFGIPIKIKDFRRSTFISRNNDLKTEINPASDYVIFDVGEKSFLEPLSQKGRNVFRVTDYDPTLLESTHKPGMHKYCITKDFLEAEVIISIPKIKTHQKAGITGALKNIVGLNGDKDYLPHHRIGGTGYGGDCYPGANRLRYWSERAMDVANSYRGTNRYGFWIKVASLLWKLSFPGAVHNPEAGWYGNDTTWRMVLDLNLIVFFGKLDGSISDLRHRTVYSLCDGIIAGQGDGPLWPEPLNLGIVSFTNNPAVNDIAMAALMGFDFRRFPLLAEAAKLLPVTTAEVYLNEKICSTSELRNISVRTRAPKGWKSYLQENEDRNTSG